LLCCYYNNVDVVSLGVTNKQVCSKKNVGVGSHVLL